MTNFTKTKGYANTMNNCMPNTLDNLNKMIDSLKEKAVKWQENMNGLQNN